MGQRIHPGVFLESDILDYDEADENDDNELSETELNKLTVASLRNIAAQEGWVLTATTKAAIVAEMLVHQELYADAKSGSAEVFEKEVSTLQTGISVKDGKISGTLKYVTGYSGYSPGDTSLQEGNFLALDITAPEGATKTTIELVGGAKGPVELDSDMDAVARITDKDTQSVKIVTTVDGHDYANVYSLSGLTLETE